MKVFDKAFEILLQNEGIKYTDESYDGQKTKYGITQKFLDDSGIKLNVKNITLDVAKDIYEREFWCKLLCYRIIDHRIAFSLFDFAVNQGHKTAIKTIQEAYNSACGRNVLVVDGIIGKNTIMALNQAGEVYLDDYLADKILREYAKEKIKEYTKDNKNRYMRFIAKVEKGEMDLSQLKEEMIKWQNIYDGWMNRTFRMM